MTAEPECPPLTSTVLVYTTEVAAARPWAVVTGSGPTPEAALDQLCLVAGEHGQEIFRQLWEVPGKPRSQWQKKMAALKRAAAQKGASLSGAFTVGSTRLAYGQRDGQPCWIAYGTLMTDNTGDGFGWLQWETGAGSSGAQR